MKKKISAYSDGIFIKNDFDEEGLAKSEHVDISVIFKERFDKEYLKFDRLKPFIVEITGSGSNSTPFLALLFGKHESQVIKFCADKYQARSVRIIDLYNIWLVPYKDDMMRVEEFNKQFHIEEVLNTSKESEK